MRLLTLLVVVCTLMANEVAVADERQETPNFKSPQEAFEAFREAYAKQDWPGVMCCLSDEAVKDAVFEAYFNCSMQLGDRRHDVAALLKKYGVDERALNAEAAKRMQAKGSPGRKRSNDEMREIVVEILHDQIDDERGFCAAAQKLLAKPDAVPVFGPIEQVEVNNDRANGSAQVTCYIFAAQNGGPIEKREITSPETYRFRKIGESWFIDR